MRLFCQQISGNNGKFVSLKTGLISQGRDSRLQRGAIPYKLVHLFEF